MIRTMLIGGVCLGVMLHPPVSGFSETSAHTASRINRMLPQFKIGQRAVYNADNNRIVLVKFPKHEQDMDNPVHNRDINNQVSYAQVKIIAEKTARWYVQYYQVRFSNGQKGWVAEQDLHSLNFATAQMGFYSKQDYINDAKGQILQYVNAIRRLHHLKALKWDFRLSNVAKLRVPQLMNRLSHANAAGQDYNALIAKRLGYRSIANRLGENISTFANVADVNITQSTVQNLNAMMYEDGGSDSQ